MTTVYQIIVDAYRQSNLIAIGVSPTNLQETEALRYLNRIVKSVFGNEAGEQFQPVPIGRNNINKPSGYPWYNNTPDGNWFIPKNARLMLNLDESLSLYLHPRPDDGSRFAISDASRNLATYPLTINGNGNYIEGATSITLNTNDADIEWFYRTDLANWVKSSPLTMFDTFPFPEEYDDFFILMLAFRLNPAYERTLDPQSQVVLERSKSQLRARFTQSIPTGSELGLVRLSKMSADRDQWNTDNSFYNPSSMFDKGWPI